jgi:uncharacterized cupin superfamily protein
MKVKRLHGRQFRQLSSQHSGEQYSQSATLEFGDDFFIHQEKLAPGKRSSALHYHPDSDECIYVLKGTLFAIKGEEILTLRSGDFVKFPKEELLPHTLENRSQEEAEFLVIKKPHSSQVLKENPSNFFSS